ncbi:hypothetical protein B0H19DRAFT_1372493 [Mycena capillaripes]|nr:hypothetical protein B0H19DRAFT_1372493 [Mycena capillaripes]
MLLAADRTCVAELKDLDRSPSVLRTEKLLAQERLDSYKYPVLTLPNEIISEILIHFLPIYPLCPPLKGIFSPTNLTYICHRWREIALANPMLWRAIPLSDDKTPGTPLTRQQLQRSQIWLNRSRNCPLSIVMDHSGMLAPESLAVLVRHRARWQYVELDLFPSDLPTIQGPMPLLQYLRLSVCAPDNNVIVFDDIPRLHTVVLGEYAASSVTLPWAQLTSLTLNLVYRQEYLTILQQTSNLRHCVLYILFLAGPPHEIALPYLESLILYHGAGKMGMPHYPDIFALPALRTLEIPTQFLGANPIDGLKSFISQAGNLERVRITGNKHLITKHAFRTAFQTLKFSFDDPYYEGDSTYEESSVGSDI